MRRVSLILMACLLISTVTVHEVFAAKEVIDVGSININVENQTWQFFDNRNNLDVAGMPSYISNSKGDYFMLDAMIVTGGFLSSFTDIIEVTVKPSNPSYSYLTFTLIRWDCDTYLGNPMKEFYLFIRYSPWMQTSAWTYTLKYRGNDRKVHIQQFQRPGANDIYGKLAPLVPHYIDRDVVQWVGIGAPNWDITYKLREYDDSGCIISEVNYPNYSYDSSSGLVTFGVSAFRGKWVRVETRKNVPGYGLGGYGVTPPELGLTARSLYIFKVPE